MTNPKNDYAALVSLSRKVGGVLTAKTVSGQKRYRLRRDLPTPLQLELDALIRKSNKRLKKLSHLVAFARKNSYHLHKKLDLFELHRAVESLLIRTIQSIAALNLLQIISRFAAFQLAQFKTLDNKKPRVNKHYGVLCVSKNKYSVTLSFLSDDKNGTNSTDTTVRKGRAIIAINPPKFQFS